jgi:hypothetical protein
MKFDNSKRLKRYRVNKMTPEELYELEEDVIRKIEGARMASKIEFVDFTHEDYLADVLDIIADMFREMGMIALASEFGSTADYSRWHMDMEKGKPYEPPPYAEPEDEVSSE